MAVALVLEVWYNPEHTRYRMACRPGWKLTCILAFLEWMLTMSWPSLVFLFFFLQRMNAKFLARAWALVVPHTGGHWNKDEARSTVGVKLA